MRLAIAAALVLAGCTQQPASPLLSRPVPLRSEEELAAMRREFDRKGRELAIVELAMAGSPDVPNAVRRGAEAQVGSETVEREARVRVEESRIRAFVQNEVAGRQGYNRNQQALAACDARSQAAQAMHPDRSLLGLHGQAAAGQVRQSCLEYYRRTGIVPGF